MACSMTEGTGTVSGAGTGSSSRTRPARSRAAVTSGPDMAATIFRTALRAAPSNGPTLACATATATATASAGVKFSGGSVSDLSTV